jgi:microsomal dipeptidase-like Zn-dependent dipeptidase
LIADLHAHYPMHLTPQGREKVLDLLVSARARSRELDRFRSVLIRGAGRFANYRSFGSGPRVTIPRLKAGGIRVCFSVLYSPFDEMDLALKYGSPPLPRYFPTLVRQLEEVEAEIAAKHSRAAAVVRNPKELTAARRARKVALVHAVEGGFHLGATPEAVDGAVTELAHRGVAYITLAHLFYRGIASNAPAIPFLPDRGYRRLFPQPHEGLTELGRAAIEAMVRENVLVDVSHMDAPPSPRPFLSWTSSTRTARSP